jgi:ubiquinone/menaquinone biosynthesis C-methylase UbiE
MHVIDVGCGAGDATMQIAEVVGPTGSVLGIDSDPAVLAVAQERTDQLGLLNVGFKTATLMGLEPEQPVDALVGRLILMHLDDPVGAVRHLSSFVRPGGVITFQDFNTTRARPVPGVPELARCLDWAVGGLRAAGRHPDPGEQMTSILQDADLPPPGVLAIGPASADPGSQYYDYLVATVASLLPMIEKNGITRAEVDLPTLRDRLRREATAARSVIYLPELVGAWTIRP